MYQNVILLRYEQGEYEDRDEDVINIIDIESSDDQIIQAVRTFIEEYAKNGYSPSYTGMTIYSQKWIDGKVDNGFDICEVRHEYDSDQDFLPIWEIDWWNGDTDKIYPFDFKK